MASTQVEIVLPTSPSPSGVGLASVSELGTGSEVPSPATSSRPISSQQAQLVQLVRAVQNTFSIPQEQAVAIVQTALVQKTVPSLVEQLKTKSLQNGKLQAASGTTTPASKAGSISPLPPVADRSISSEMKTQGSNVSVGSASPSQKSITIGPSASEVGSAASVATAPQMVQRAWLQQQQLASIQRQERQQLFGTLTQLLETDRSVIEGSQNSLSKAIKELQPKCKDVDLEGALKQVLALHTKALQLHQLMKSQLGTVAQAQTDAQEKQLKLSQQHIQGLYQSLQALATHAGNSEKRLGELQSFKAQATKIMENNAKEHSLKLAQVTQAAMAWQNQAKQNQAANDELKSKVSAQESSKKESTDFTNAQVQEILRQCAALKAHVLAVLGDDALRTDLEEELV